MYQWNCQKRTVSNAQLTGYQYSIPPSTYEIAMAIQNANAGTTNTTNSSLFKANGQEKNIISQYVEYANQTLPPQQDVLGYTVGVSNTMNSRYAETYLLSDGDQAVPFFGSGPESPDAWFTKRGPYTRVSFKKDSSDKSTQAKYWLALSSAPSNMNALLFAKYRTTALIQVKDGQVVDVRTNFSV
jgi:hypothetical protein